MKTEAHAHFNLYTVKSFFDAQTCALLIEELRRADAVPAPVYGQGAAGAVNERVRKVTQLAPSRETLEMVKARLLKCRDEVALHFGLSLKRCEEPQFLRYRAGDFFVAHQDGNTGMLRSGREQSRNISVVIFLNRQSETALLDAYSGGTLVFSDWRPPGGYKSLNLHGEAGLLVAFRAETTHEVLPVTNGERFSIVSWYG